MDVEKAIALVTAAGIGVTDRRRNEEDSGWRLCFANGAELEVKDNGELAASGKGADDVAKLLDLPGNPGAS
ncbi:hypothetical protein GCM10007874_03990 [Labrys miyagiensis]|uniref:Uncharacterized protein n=1 Tax=Labrys miyagiensis TaxID=346912 RepID=A0ABQ6CFC8_9HYPH|nr:hypothetical protein [Labrys miyagiensis]GLS17384.1 hypothetical protein GCM10007874_03990 [Labrys miyagiensis]